MKNNKKNIAKVIVKIVKAGVKNDINSTSSTWFYQPRMPKGVNKYKK